VYLSKNTKINRKLLKYSVEKKKRENSPRRRIERDEMAAINFSDAVAVIFSAVVAGESYPIMK
jgi:hypothetical protein